jgi:hypothetical protein
MKNKMTQSIIQGKKTSIIGKNKKTLVSTLAPSFNAISNINVIATGTHKINNLSTYVPLIRIGRVIGIGSNCFLFLTT